MQQDHLPSAVLGADAWAAAHDELVGVAARPDPHPVDQPAGPAGPGDRRRRASLAACCAPRAWSPEVIEPVPGRGSVIVRLRGDGTGGDPLLLLSPPRRRPGGRRDGWTHAAVRRRRRRRLRLGSRRRRHEVDGRAGDAWSSSCSRAGPAPPASTPPATPSPASAATSCSPARADEEAGGTRRARSWLVEHRPDTLRAAGALNEAGGVSVELAGRRFYPIQVAEKGFEVVPDQRPRHVGPRLDAARRQRRRHGRRGGPPPGRPGRAAPDAGRCARLLDGVAAALPPDAAALAARHRRRATRAARGRHPRACATTMYARALRALLRDTISPGRHPRGHQVQRDPGRGDDRDRLPHAPRHHRGRHARGGPRAPRRPRARTATWSTSSARRRSRRPPRASSTTCWRPRSAPTTPTASRSR